MSSVVLHSAIRHGGTHSRHRPRGLRKTPRHKLAAAIPFRPLKAPSDGFAIVPSQLSMWDNDRDGDCVTAEEAFAKAVWSIMCGQPELFIPDAEVIRWASKYGFLNGAELPDVMDKMAVDGFTVGGVNYKDGPYGQAVDYSNESTLQSAIETGPVKIGIDADALSPDAGNGSGWFSIGGSPGSWTNEDHCVGLCGHGTASFLFGKLGLPVPSAIDPTKRGYLLFTWSSIGFVDHDWLMSTEAEAWVRNPTTVGQSPVPGPGPSPTPPGPTPVPPSPTPGPTLLNSTGTLSIPGQSIRDGFRTLSIPGQSVPVSVMGVLPSSGLTTDGIAALLAANGFSQASLGISAINWQQLLQALLVILPMVLPLFLGSVSDARDAAGKLTPAQWQQIIAAVLYLIQQLLAGGN